jgi:hypothetical protein
MAHDEPTSPASAAPGRGPGHHAWVVLPLATFLTASSAVWLRQNLLAYPPPWDQANYLTMGLRFFHAWQDGGPRALAGALSESSAVWPPLFPLSTAALYSLLGESRLVAHLTNGLFVVLLLAGIQSLAASAHGRRAGLLAAVLACGFSDVVRLSRDYLLDFPASALLAVAVAALVRSHDLRGRGWTLAFGAAVGLTALTKTMTGIFMVAPVALALWRRRRAGELGGALRHLGLAALLALAVAGPWWLPHLRDAIGYLYHYGLGSGAAPYATGGRTVLGWRNVTYYGWVLVNNAVSFPTAAILAGLFLHRAVRRLRGGDRLVASETERTLWCWLLAGYAVLTLVPNKGGDRYALFLLPPLAALYAGWLCAVPHRVARAALVALALCAGALNYVAQTWGFAGLPRLVVLRPFVFLQQGDPHLLWMRSTVPLSADVPWPASHLAADAYDAVVGSRRRRALEALEAARSGGGLDAEDALRLAYRHVLDREPDPGAHVHLEALRSGALDAQGLVAALMRSDEPASRHVRVLVVPDHPVINAATLGYYAESARVRVRHAHLQTWPAPGESLAGFHAAILKEGGWQGPEFTTRSSPALGDALRDAASGFRPAGSWPCPDGSRVVLLVR